MILYSLYILRNPIDQTIFYVGLTVNPYRRACQHWKIDNATFKKNPHKATVIKKIRYFFKRKPNNFLEVLATDMEKETAERLEIEMIKKLREVGCPLTNISLGGSVPSQETLNKLRRPKTEETKKKMKGNRNGLGHKHSKESRKLMSKAGKGKKKSEDHKRKIGDGNSKPIIQYNLYGRELNRFKSATAAANILGREARNISRCLLNQQKTAYGFVWRFARKAP